MHAIFLLALNLFFLHDFHVSQCRIDYKEAEKALQISLNLFLEDVEWALEKQGHKKLRLGSAREHPEADQLIFDYIQEHLRLWVQGELLELTWVGREPADDPEGMWCYLEVKNVRRLPDLTIENTLLLEVLSDQKNMVTVNHPPHQEVLLVFTQGQTTEKLSWK